MGRCTHILLVEDDLEIARMLVETLEESGFTASSATSGTEMNKILLANDVDLIVLDIMLPGENGLSICRLSFPKIRLGFF